MLQEHLYNRYNEISAGGDNYEWRRVNVHMAAMSRDKYLYKATKSSCYTNHWRIRMLRSPMLSNTKHIASGPRLPALTKIQRETVKVP